MLTSLLSLDRPAAIAHRGGSALRPENTLAAFDHARELGVAAIECDVQLSRDGELMVIHDATLDRTTGATGPVAERTASELARVDAGFQFGAAAGYPYRGCGCGVPRLSDVLARYPDMLFVIEIKGESLEAAERAISLVRSMDRIDRVVIGGFSHRVLTAVRQWAPEAVTSASQEESRQALVRSRFGLRPRPGGFRLFQMPYILRGKQILRKGFVRAARRGAVPVQAWTVDNPDDMRLLIEWGVTGIISDRPDVAMEVIESLEGQRA
jgi:glycerophosphoryl diester phosphodiesterase